MIKPAAEQLEVLYENYEDFFLSTFSFNIIEDGYVRTKDSYGTDGYSNPENPEGEVTVTWGFICFCAAQGADVRGTDPGVL